jgi:hypothetical protein
MSRKSLKPRVQGILSCKTTTTTTSHDILQLEKVLNKDHANV